MGPVSRYSLGFLRRLLGWGCGGGPTAAKRSSLATTRSPVFRYHTYNAARSGSFLGRSSSMATDNSKLGSLYVIGNPLLDMVATVPASFLQEFSLKRGEAVLASPEQMSLYNRLEREYRVTRLPGGSALNTARIAQALSRHPKSVVYAGAVGNDDHGAQLKTLAEQEGIDVKFQISPDHPTGVCAVLINEKERSLCTSLGACLTFCLPENWKEDASRARLLYAAGYALSASPDNVLQLARYCSTHQTCNFVFNLGAPFILEIYKEEILEMLSMTNIVIGNHEEFEILARVQGVIPPPREEEEKDSHMRGSKKEGDAKSDIDRAYEICEGVLNLMKASSTSASTTNGLHASPVVKIALMTRGREPVIFCQLKSDGEIVRGKEEVPDVPAEKVVDTNGAGDAFAGGFMLAFVQGKSIKESAALGICAAANVIQHEGFAYSLDDICAV